MGYTDAFTDFTIGLLLLAFGFAVLWLLAAALRHRASAVSIRIEPPIISHPKFHGMIIIDKNKKGEYFTKTVAGNYEVLQHGEGIKTKPSLRKHIQAFAKAVNSNGLVIDDRTGDFPELHNYKK